MKKLIHLLFLFSGYGALAQPVVINEIYGGGGNSGAVYTHDFVELFNPSASTVDLSGWSVQYASAASSGSWQVTPLTGTIEPGRHFLVQLAGGANGQALPTPDATGTTNLAATAGKIALVQSSVALNGSCPSASLIIDKVGYGSTANCFEGATPAPAPSATLAVRRVPDGTDSNQNGIDFRTGAPQPQHSFPRSQLILFESVSSKQYGEAAFDLAATASSGLAVSFTSSNPSVATIDGSRLTITGAGNANITATQAGNTQFEQAQSSQPFQVIKAPLLVMAPSASRMQGEPNPGFVLTYSGFVNGEDESVLDDPPVPTCVAVAASPPSTYPILVIGGLDNNYEIVPTSGVLTVLPNPPSNTQLPYLKSPDANKTGIGLTTRLTCSYVPGALLYTIEVSDIADFSRRVSLTSGPRSQVVGGFLPATRHYVRVKTELDPSWGPVRLFSTASSVELTYLKDPADGATGVSWLPRLLVNDAAMTSYVIQLSTDAQFLNPLEFTTLHGSVEVQVPLNYSAQYFTRVRANQLPENWGPVHSFTTGRPTDFSFLRAPKEGTLDVPVETRVTLNFVPGATSYFLRLRKTDEPGQEEILERQMRSFVIWLSPSTRYEASARTDLPGEWSLATTFQTAAAPDLSYLSSPASGSVNVMTSPIITAKAILGAGRYTIEVNTLSDFSGVGEVKSSKGRSMRFHLAEGQQYFVRVETDLRPGVWGAVGMFVTESAQVAADANSNPDDYRDQFPNTKITSRRIQATEEESQEVSEGNKRSWVFPNPFQDFVTVRTDAEIVRVYSVTGQEVCSVSVSGNVAGLETISWPAGVYVVEEAGKSGTRRTKVIKR